MMLEASYEKNETIIDEDSLIGGMLVFAYDFGWYATLFGCIRYARYTERLHRFRVKVKSSSLPGESGLLALKLQT